MVNTDKTVVMIFKKGTRTENVELYYDNEILKNVSNFTYLGVTLSFNGKFYQTQKSLSEQATKALFSLNSLFEVLSLNISEKIKLFDSMVLPILNYASERTRVDKRVFWPQYFRKIEYVCLIGFRLT